MIVKLIKHSYSAAIQFIRNHLYNKT